MHLTHSTAETLLNLLLRQQQASLPATHHLALLSSFDEASQQAVELVGAGYARAAVTFAPADGSQIVNAAPLLFPVAQSAWPAASYLAIVDAPTQGQMLVHCPLHPPRQISAGGRFTLAAGGLRVQWSTGSITSALSRQLLEFLFRAATLNPSPAVYVSLLSHFSSESDWTEVSQAGFARQPVTFAAPQAGATHNDQAIQFAAASTLYTATHVAVFDSPAGGQLLLTAAMQAPLDVAPGLLPVIAAGDLSVALR